MGISVLFDLVYFSGNTCCFHLVSKFHDLHFLHPSFYQNNLLMHTCDKFEKGIREVFFSFQGGFSKMYRTYRKIVNSHQGDFLIL